MAEILASVHPTASGSGLASYATMAAALANARIDLNALLPGNDLVIETQGIWPGFDTVAADALNAIGAANSLIIRGDAQNYVRGKHLPGQYGLRVSGTEALFGGQPGGQFYAQGLYVENFANGGSNGAFECNTADCDWRFTDSIFKSENSAGVVIWGGTTRGFFDCCLAIDSALGFLSFGGLLVQCRNCTGRNCSTNAFETTGNPFTATNCLADNSGANYQGAITGSNNGSSNATAPGSSPLLNQVFTFEAAGSGLLSLADTSGAKGWGVSLAAASPPLILDVEGRTFLDPPTIGINELGRVTGAQMAPLYGMSC